MKKSAEDCLRYAQDTEKAFEQVGGFRGETILVWFYCNGFLISMTTVQFNRVINVTNTFKDA